MRTYALWAFCLLLSLDPSLGAGEGGNSITIQVDNNNNVGNDSDGIARRINKLNGTRIAAAVLHAKPHGSTDKQDDRSRNLANRHNTFGTGHIPPKMPVLSEQRVNVWKYPIHRGRMQSLSLIHPSLKRWDNATFMRNVFRRYKKLNLRGPSRIYSARLIETGPPNHHRPDAFPRGPNNNLQKEPTDLNRPTTYEMGPNTINSDQNATSPYILHQRAHPLDRQKMDVPFKQSSIDLDLSRLTAKDYEIAMWFGVALGAFLVLAVGGSTVLVRKIMPRRFKSIFERVPYGPVHDLALPVETACEYRPMWSPVTCSNTPTFVTVRDAKYTDERRKGQH